MGISEFILNASSILLSFLVAILASYFVTIFHELHSTPPSGFISGYFHKIKNDKLFLIVNIFIVILLLTVARNLFVVNAINSQQIPELRKNVAGLEANMSERQIRDKLATFEEYFSISAIKNNGDLEGLLLKPAKFNTFIISVKDISITLHFKEQRYTNYSIQGGEN